MFLKHTLHFLLFFSLAITAIGCDDHQNNNSSDKTKVENEKDEINKKDVVVYLVKKPNIPPFYKSQLKMLLPTSLLDNFFTLHALSPSELKTKIENNPIFNPVFIWESALIHPSTTKFGFRTKIVNFEVASDGLEIIFEFTEFVEISNSIIKDLNSIKTDKPIALAVFTKEDFSFLKEEPTLSSATSFLTAFLNNNNIKAYKEQSQRFSTNLDKVETDIQGDIEKGLAQTHHDITLLLLKNIDRTIEFSQLWPLILALWTQTPEEFSNTLADFIIQLFEAATAQKNFDDGLKLNPDEYLQLAEEKGVPQEVLNKIKSKLNAIDFTSPLAGQELASFRKWIGLILNLPWKEETVSLLPINPSEIKEEFKKSITGFKEPIDAVVDFLVLNEAKDPTQVIAQNAILLVGPPGVGKTHLAKEIARILGRKFMTINLGGKSTEGEIRGHNSVWLGAGPGKILKALETVKVNNPVILLDEIDKLTSGGGNAGNPEAALLELLDPIQMAQFTDNYAEVPFDLTKILFITTANSYENIPHELLNRLNVIFIDGYGPKEKLAITKKHLLPKLFQNYRLTQNHPVFEDEAITFLIDTYTRESGVRNLEKNLRSLIAAWISCQKESTCDDRDKPFTKDRIQKLFKKKEPLKLAFSKEPKVGVVHGLYWSAGGGGVMDIQANMFKKSPQDTEFFETTGNLQQVIKESMHVARTVALSHAAQYGFSLEDALEKKIHIHALRASTSKDGPSAGAALTTVIISLLTNRKVDLNYAMTGEINLWGEITAIGGLKEKILGAMNEGMSFVLYPKENQKDVDKIIENDEIDLSRIKLIPVEHIDEVLKLVLIP